MVGGGGVKIKQRVIRGGPPDRRGAPGPGPPERDRKQQQTGVAQGCLFTALLGDPPQKGHLRPWRRSPAKTSQAADPDKRAERLWTAWGPVRALEAEPSEDQSSSRPRQASRATLHRPRGRSGSLEAEPSGDQSGTGPGQASRATLDRPGAGKGLGG